MKSRHFELRDNTFLLSVLENLDPIETDIYLSLSSQEKSAYTSYVNSLKVTKYRAHIKPPSEWIDLHCWHMSYGEIAVKLNISAYSVIYALNTGLRKLKDIINNNPKYEGLRTLISNKPI